MALDKIWNLRKLYPYNIAEGEGAGTSYEYVAKAIVLDKMWKYCKPKSVLVAGLPQIYGLSLDFLLWGKLFDCPVTVVEDRKDIVDKLKSCLKGLQIPFPRIILVDNIENIGDSLEQEETFDIVFSCEVLQRIGNKEKYCKALEKNANYLAMFVPNKGNMAHATKSGLETLSLEELESLSERLSQKELLAKGYIDFPPWPPGIKRSEEKREKAEHGFLEKRFLDFCQIWTKIEMFIPFKYRFSYSHIVYVFLKPIND